MALSPTQSIQFANFAADPMLKQDSSDWNSKLRSSYAKFTAASSGSGSVSMIQLPGGKIRINKELSFYNLDAAVGATVTFDFGLAAYVSATAEGTPNEVTV